MSDKIAGSCLCGQVTFKVWGPFKGFRLCHCSRCQKASGSAHVSNIFTGPDQVEFLTGAELVKRYDHLPAETFSKCFCGNCGSVVPYNNRPSTALIIPAGSLDEDPGIVPEANIFWPDRACWYDAAVGAERCEEYP